MDRDIQTTVLLESTRIRSPEETWRHSDSSGRPSANAGVKNFQEIKLYNINNNDNNNHLKNTDNKYRITTKK